MIFPIPVGEFPYRREGNASVCGVADGVSPLWLDGNAGVFNAKRPCVRIETQGRCMENFFTL